MSEVIAQKKLMGSPFVLKAFSSSVQSEWRIQESFEAAFAEIARIENLLTDFRESPFHDINKFAGVHPVVVDAETFSLIQRTRKLSEESHGAFDITFASVGHITRKFFSSTGLSQTEEEHLRTEIEQAKQFVNYRKIVLDPVLRTVFLPHAKMKIGFGGVGKGYAVDCAFRVLMLRGIVNFCINGAGDLRVHSESLQTPPWKVGIKNPFSPEARVIGMIPARQGAIATSGDYERFVKSKNGKMHHVLDARTQECRDDVVSVTILAPTALQADLYATTVMALGVCEGMLLLETHSEMSGVIVDKDGKVHFSKNFSRAKTLNSKEY